MKYTPPLTGTAFILMVIAALVIAVLECYIIQKETDQEIKDDKENGKKIN